MFLRILSLCVMCMFAFSSIAFAFQGYVQTVGDGASMSWGSGEVAVTHDLSTSLSNNKTRQPLAIRRGVSRARKELLDLILSVRIDGHQTVSAFIADDRVLASRLRGLVQNSPLERPVTCVDGGTIRVYEQFRGKLAELILPTTLPFQSGIPPKLTTSMNQTSDSTNSLPEETVLGAKSYSGVIVDARHLKITPALAPVIYGQDGLGVYGPFLLSRKAAIQHGVVAYATTMDVNQLRERVGRQPLVVRAVSAYGAWRTDLIIPASSAKLVRGLMQTHDIIRSCRLVIVLSTPEDDLSPTLSTGPFESELPVKE